MEETEAAHDLLSLSQSLPPLPAPGAVSIHQTSTSKVEETASISYTYSPLATEATFQTTTTQLPVSIPCYQPPIVYVVQVNALPTPPTSECSSDAENQAVSLRFKVKENGRKLFSFIVFFFKQLIYLNCISFLAPISSKHNCDPDTSRETRRYHHSTIISGTRYWWIAGSNGFGYVRKSGTRQGFVCNAKTTNYDTIEYS